MIVIQTSFRRWLIRLKQIIVLIATKRKAVTSNLLSCNVRNIFSGMCAQRKSRPACECATGRILDSQVCKVSSCGQRKLWSDCAIAQADLSLRWAYMSKGMFSRCALIHAFNQDLKHRFVFRKVWIKRKLREKSMECHNHKPQPFPDTKRKRKPTNPNTHKSNKRTKSTKISSVFPKRRNRNSKRTEKHKNKMTQSKT